MSCSINGGGGGQLCLHQNSLLRAWAVYISRRRVEVQVSLGTAVTVRSPLLELTLVIASYFKFGKLAKHRTFLVGNLTFLAGFTFGVNWYRELHVVVQSEIFSLFAVPLEVLRKPPGTLAGHAVSHVFDFALAPSHLSLMNHIAVDLNEVNDSLPLIDGGGLVRCKADFAVHDEVVEVCSFFNVLQRIRKFSKCKTKIYHWDFEHWGVADNRLMHLDHIVPVCEGSHNVNFFSAVGPCDSH